MRSYSQANSSRCAYQLPVNSAREAPRAGAANRSAPDRSARDHILDDVRLAVAQHDLARRVITGSHVSAIVTHAAAHEEARTGWSVCGCSSSDASTPNQPFNVTCRLVVLAVGGRLGSPRRSLFKVADASRFEGHLRRGLHDDCTDLPWASSRVAIIGVGNFAVEHARHALEKGASHVTIICRRAGLVCPMVIEHLQHRRPVGVDAFDSDAKADEALAGAWARCYMLSAGERTSTHTHTVVGCSLLNQRVCRISVCVRSAAT